MRHLTGVHDGKLDAEVVELFDGLGVEPHQGPLELLARHGQSKSADVVLSVGGEILEEAQALGEPPLQ